MASLPSVAGRGAIPVLAAAVGGAATAWREPGERLRGMVRHFAGGDVRSRGGWSLA